MTTKISNKKLNRWIEAGLMSEEQAGNITDYEKSLHGGRLLRSLLGIAFLTIIIGVLSIIASNWMYISGDVKITYHLLLNAAAAFAVWHLGKRDNKLWQEGALLAFFGLNLTLIVLIGQVFQLHGNWASALSLWMIISSPAVLIYGARNMTELPWCLALIVTVYMIWDHFLGYMNVKQEFFFTIIPLSLTPVAFIIAGKIEVIRSSKPALANVATNTGIALLIILAIYSTFLWYDGYFAKNVINAITINGTVFIGYITMLAILLAPVAAAMWFYKTKILDKNTLIFIAGSVISYSFMFILLPPTLDFIAPIHFCLYWLFIGWIGSRTDNNSLITLSITLIVLRVIGVYIELFGSLLTTGFGLIISGFALLGIVYSAGKIRKYILLKGARHA